MENAFSDDDVTVAYYKKGDTSTIDTTQDVTGLLSVVASKNIDQTGEIIRNLIRAIFIFVSGDFGFSFNRLTGTSERVMMTEQTVDPFDLSAMAALNKSLREYGYCLTLGKYTFNTGRSSPESYCDRPDLSLSAAAAPPFLRAAKDQQNLVGTLPDGVFYRPRQPYQLFVYVRDDPGSGKAWELRMTKDVMLENLSPILALRVNRTIFAEYRTALAFDRGNLVDVCIAKGSEVLGGLQIPST
ncbi:hypothetical protein [Sinorhizobium psoraleae]|uniref:Uncharacterized protein n=1 Tax=Sinorhizobium psoraleae TaxID=520838 RepID=A0ABT4K9U4_9HYPH|nr:hypothetical protein [Sinorhizobium psoraleae]MCZ4088720.1 hypothetical protein [Sinorhizobium psoraleae]